MASKPIASAKSFFRSLTAALAATEVRDPATESHVQGLVTAMRAARLTANPAAPAPVGPGAEWRQLFAASDGWRDDPLLAPVHALGQLYRWFSAEQFYPEPEHHHFSRRVWGTLIAGQQDALFDCQQRYIALLIVIAPQTTYPLHAHRIEETYFLLSGEADWSHYGEDWITLGPGSVFHNHSYQPHTIRSLDQPLLTLGLYLPPFGWEGGLL